MYLSVKNTIQKLLMNKITNPQFKLSEVLAMQFHNTAESGANRPLIIKGVNLETKTSNNYVLKYRGAERMDASACGRELLSSFIIAELGINIPNPVIVNVRDEFLKTNGIQFHPDFSKIIKSKGLNFGCEYLDGNIPPLQSQNFTPKQKEQAASIFLFDMLMQNADRNKIKPNMFIVNENIFVIDHELPYGFLATFSFLASSTPWILSDIDIEMGKKHFFYPLLFNNRAIQWQKIRRPFLKITSSFWAKAWETIPREWMTESDFNNTQKHFTDIQSNFKTFNNEIWNKILMA